MDNKAKIKLSKKIEDFPTFFKFLHIATSPTRARVGDGVVPIDTIGEFLAGLEWLG